MTAYPGAIPSLTRPVAGNPGNDGSATDATVVIDRVSDELEAIATELGTNPKGAAASVRARLDALDTMVAGKETAGAAAAAQAAAIAASQPVDSDLTAIAALSTTSYGRSFLALADAAAGRTALGLGTAATQATSAFDAAGSAAAAQAASQPLDSDLTAIAALTTTSFGRSLLALADAAAGRTALALGGAATLNVGTATGTVAAGDDSRMTNSRTPTAHASAHLDNGSDPISTFTPTRSGVVPPSGGGTSNFLRADGTFAAPSGGSGVSFQDEGVAVTSRSDVDFRGGSVTVFDASSKTNVVSTGGMISDPVPALGYVGTTTPPQTYGTPGEFHVSLNQLASGPPIVWGPKHRATYVVTNRSSSGTTKVITTSYAHTIPVGARISVTNVSGATSSYNGRNMLVTAVTSTTITYTGTGSLTESSTASSGNVVGHGIDHTFPISNRSSSGTTRTITTATAHSMVVGQTFAIQNVTSDYNVTSAVVVSVPSTTTFTYVGPTSLTEASTPSSGELVVGWPFDGYSTTAGPNGTSLQRVGRMRIPTYPATAFVLPTAGAYFTLDSAIPADWTQSNGSNALSISGGFWQATSATGVSGIYYNFGAEPTAFEMAVVVSTLPSEAGGLAFCGSVATSGICAYVDNAGAWGLRLLNAGVVMAAGAGTFVAGDWLIFQKQGRVVTARRITPGAPPTYRADVSTIFQDTGAGSGYLDCYSAMSSFSFGFKGSSVGRILGGALTDGAGAVRVLL